MKVTGMLMQMNRPLNLLLLVEPMLVLKPALVLKP